MVVVWVVRAQEIADAGLLPAWTACLSDEEHRARARGLDEPTRVESLVSRGLLRRALSQVEAVEPAAWRFGAGRHGRPLALGPRRAPSFNVAHSCGTVACAIGDAAELGLDVEDTRRALDVDGVARVSFSRRELAGLDALGGAARRARFFELWTLKEAYLKARGAGLVLPLDGFTISGLDAGAPEISFEAGFDDAPAGWRLALPALGEAITSAVAARCEGALHVEVRRPRPEAWLAS